MPGMSRDTGMLPRGLRGTAGAAAGLALSSAVARAFALTPARSPGAFRCQTVRNTLSTGVRGISDATLGTSHGVATARNEASQSGARGPVAGAIAALCGAFAARRRFRGTKSCVKRHAGIVRDLHLDGYPIHGPGYYWTLSPCTGAVLIYMPIADDVSAKDIVFSCSDGRLKLGLTEAKGGLKADDELIYTVDVDETYFIIEDKGKYGERCCLVWLYKLTREQDWYAYDRFLAPSERFLLKGDKESAFLDLTITNKVYLDVEVDGGARERIVIGLFGKHVPKTVENFRCLCTGEKGVSESGAPLSYKDTNFHRIFPDYIIQGGQTVPDPDGGGGESIYGKSFPDENLRVKFVKPGVLAMANCGPDTNGSQFFITTAKAENLNNLYVGFGEVLEGMPLLMDIEKLGDDEGDPSGNVVIVDCGELPCEDGLKGSFAVAGGVVEDPRKAAIRRQLMGTMTEEDEKLLKPAEPEVSG